MQFHKNDEKSQGEFIKIDRFLLARMRARVREGKYTVLQILLFVVCEFFFDPVHCGQL